MSKVERVLLKLFEDHRVLIEVTLWTFSLLDGTETLQMLNKDRSSD